MEKRSVSNSCFGFVAVSSVMYLLGVELRTANLFPPHFRLVLVLTPVTGLVPVAVGLSHNFFCVALSKRASLKSAPSILASFKSLEFSTTRFNMALVKFAPTKILRSMSASLMSAPVKSTPGATNLSGATEREGEREEEESQLVEMHTEG